MTLEDKIDFMLAYIDEKACDKSMSVSANLILSSLSSRLVLSDRELGIIFKFITNYPLLPYIKERKLMASLKYLIDGGDDINKAIEISGYDNQSSFTSRFSKAFKITPSQLIKQIKDGGNKEELITLYYKSPITWESLLKKEIITEVNFMKKENETIFDVNSNDYEKVMEILRLNSLYGISKTFSKYLYDYAVTNKYDINKVYDILANNFVLYGSKEFKDVYYDDEIIMNSDETYYIEHEIMPYINDQIYKYVAFDMDVPEYDMDIMVRLLGWDFNDVKKLSRYALILIGSQIKWDINFCIKSGDYYAENIDDRYSEDDFWEYVNNLEMNYPIEEAFDMLIPISEFDNITIDFDEYEDDYSGYEFDGYYSRSDIDVYELDKEQVPIEDDEVYGYSEEDY